MSKGALPTLQELGPYVFRENRTKIQISHDDTTDTVTYKEHISYHFEEEMSGSASLKDVVTIINVPFAVRFLHIKMLMHGYATCYLSLFLRNEKRPFVLIAYI